MGVRKEDLVAFQAIDAFGLKNSETKQPSILDFFDKNYPYPIYKEQLAKMLNAAASDIAGRAYFTANHRFLSTVCAAMMAEPRDTILRLNLLGVLEKLSVR